MIVTRKFPNSSNIDRVRWNDETLVLDVWFKSRKDRGSVVTFYRYSNVGYPTFNLIMLNAESVGSAFNHMIVQDAERYPFRKMTWGLPPRDSRGRFIRAAR